MEFCSARFPQSFGQTLILVPLLLSRQNQTATPASAAYSVISIASLQIQPLSPELSSG